MAATVKNYSEKLQSVMDGKHFRNIKSLTKKNSVFRLVHTEFGDEIEENERGKGFKYVAMVDDFTTDGSVIGMYVTAAGCTLEGKLMMEHIEILETGG